MHLRLWRRALSQLWSCHWGSGGKCPMHSLKQDDGTAERPTHLSLPQYDPKMKPGMPEWHTGQRTSRGGSGPPSRTLGCLLVGSTTALWDILDYLSAEHSFTRAGRCLFPALKSSYLYPLLVPSRQQKQHLLSEFGWDGEGRGDRPPFEPASRAPLISTSILFLLEKEGRWVCAYSK